MQTTSMPQSDPFNTEQSIRRFTFEPSLESSSVNWWNSQDRYTETHHYGTVGDDQMKATSPDLNVFYTGKGDDYAIGSAGRDVMYTEEGNDTVDGGRGDDQMWAGSGDDLLLGGAGDDRLYGMWGDDTLFGDAGDDFLDGGNGSNTMAGGAGHDTFRWSFFLRNTPASSDIDIVHDFTQGEDRLEFTHLLNLSGHDLQLSIRQVASAGVLELHNSRAELVRTIVLENTDLLSVKDAHGTQIDTLSSQDALQRMMETDTLVYF